MTVKKVKGNVEIYGHAPEADLDLRELASRVDLNPYKNFAKEKLGIEFNNIGLLVTALTHRSYANEHKLPPYEHNERLEFLGDAVLELVTSDFLFKKFREQEGVMTAIRSALVKTESIGEAGTKLGYAPLIRMSKGEKMGTKRSHFVIIADCFEAVIGAIYVDQGYERARKFIDEHILSNISTVLYEGSWRDAKSYIQEIAQKTEGETPVYRTLREEGPDHDKLFVVGVYIGGELMGIGEGHSKQDAQVAAARKVIKKYRERAEKMGIVV